MRVRRSQSVAAASVCFAAALAACGSSGSGKAAGRPAAVTAPMTFAMWGDTPYSPAEAQAVPKLVDQVNATKPAFSIFVGDLQGGDPCLNSI